MGEKSQITFMQTRLLRLASEEWKMPLEKVVDIFRSLNVFDYIESGYGIFHCEGDEVVLEDVEIFLEIKQEKIKAINKSKFIKHREEIVKDLRQKRNATKNQHRISFNLCLDILSTINDLLAYETIFEKNDYSKIVQSKEELNQIIEALKKERDKNIRQRQRYFSGRFAAYF